MMRGHPGGNPGANLKSISHRCYLFEVAFVWELTKETIVLPLGCLQGGVRLLFFLRLSDARWHVLLFLFFITLKPRVE